MDWLVREILRELDGLVLVVQGLSVDRELLERLSTERLMAMREVLHAMRIETVLAQSGRDLRRDLARAQGFSETRLEIPIFNERRHREPLPAWPRPTRSRRPHLPARRPPWLARARGAPRERRPIRARPGRRRRISAESRPAPPRPR